MGCEEFRKRKGIEWEWKNTEKWKELRSVFHFYSFEAKEEENNIV